MSCFNIPSRFCNPNVYAQQYANANGISFSEAKSQLKSKYGDPEPLFNFKSGSSTTGPQYPGDYDPVSYKSKPDGSENTSSSKTKGPQNPGDYDPVSHKSKTDGTKNTSSSKTKGPQNPGDYDPVGHKSKPDGTKNIFASTSPAGASDPESYAKTVCLEKYGDTKEAHMTQVRAELKAKYGNPTNPFASMC